MTKWKLLKDKPLDWNVIGFIAKVGEILAKNKIVMGVMSAYSKDHFIVKDKDAKKAMKLLENGIK